MTSAIFLILTPDVMSRSRIKDNLSPTFEAKNWGKLRFSSVFLDFWGQIFQDFRPKVEDNRGQSRTIEDIWGQSGQNKPGPGDPGLNPGAAISVTSKEDPTTKPWSIVTRDQFLDHDIQLKSIDFNYSEIEFSFTSAAAWRNLGVTDKFQLKKLYQQQTRWQELWRRSWSLRSASRMWRVQAFSKPFILLLTVQFPKNSFDNL